MTDDFHPPIGAVRAAVERALAEDVGPLGDLSGSLVAGEAGATAAFVARQEGVVAGMSCVAVTCELVDRRLSLEVEIDDGGRVAAGSQIARLSGPLRSLLVAERTALNFSCHLSGVASLTRRYVDLASRANPAVRILDTRKTTPGLRALEKAAVRAGGGFNHRGSLSDAVLLKDNHLSALSIEEAVLAATRRFPGRMVEVECDTLDEVKRATAAGASAVLCDNMSPEQLAAAVRLVEEMSPGRRPLIEASGGIGLDNVAQYAKAGPDVISVGALTHSAPALDIGLDVTV